MARITLSRLMLVTTSRLWCGGFTDSLVTFHFDGATVDNVKALRFTSSQQSFEFDNVAVQPIPEPGVWAMMLIGFAAMGFSLRRREKTKLRVRFA